MSKGQVGDLGGLPIPLVVLSARGTRSTLPDTLVLLLTPCFCSQLLRSSSWIFGLFVSYP